MRLRLLLAAALCLPACHGGKSRDVEFPASGGEEVPPSAAGVSLSRDVWPIIIVRCQICHTSGSGAAQVPDMRMSDPVAVHQAWVRVQSQCNPNFFRVIPERSDLSFVFDKISHEAPLCGQRMPLEGPPLSEVEQSTIRAWIDQGALLN
jgi:hypothetical protein